MPTRRLLLGMLIASPAAAQAPGAVAPLEGGGWRLAFPAGQAVLPGGAAAGLAELGRRLAEMPAGRGRITVAGQASGPANDASATRRLALARAQAVRAALAEGGLEETRVDVRSLGRTPEALDVADILPPGSARAAQTR